MTITYGVAETIGHRREMEDAHSIWQEERLHIFGAEVYDGHAGSRAAMLAAERLSRHFLDRVKAEPEPTAEDVFTAEALREAYLVTDRYIVEQDTESGTAAATLYLLGDRFLAANAGDVRIVVGNGSRAVSLTVDHKPALPEEKARIEALGGSVVVYDVARVEGILAMSRALGDAPLKPFVTAEPRIAEGFLGRENDLAIIACDGLWDVLTPDQAVTLARTARTPDEAAKLLQMSALDKGSSDNITVIVLDLRHHAAAGRRGRLEVTRVVDHAASASRATSAP